MKKLEGGFRVTGKDYKPLRYKLDLLSDKKETITYLKELLKKVKGAKGNRFSLTLQIEELNSVREQKKTVSELKPGDRFWAYSGNPLDRT